MTIPERELHLDRIMLMSFDMTVKGLIEEEAVISEDTVTARNETVAAIKMKIKERKDNYE